MNAEKLTQKSIDAVRKAQSIAVMQSNSVIEPIHLLAGLIRQENGLIPQLLKKMNIDEDIFDGEVEKKIQESCNGEYDLRTVCGDGQDATLILTKVE